MTADTPQSTGGASPPTGASPEAGVLQGAEGGAGAPSEAPAPVPGRRARKPRPGPRPAPGSTDQGADQQVSCALRRTTGLAPDGHNVVVSIPIDPELLALIGVIAEALGVSRADTIRRLILRGAEAALIRRDTRRTFGTRRAATPARALPAGTANTENLNPGSGFVARVQAAGRYGEAPPPVRLGELAARVRLPRAQGGAT